MKNRTNKFSLLLITLFFAITIQAQNFQGIATYFSKTNVEMNFEGREMSEEMKQRIKERMKSQFERTYKLSFDKSTSVYKQEEQLESPGGGGGMRMMVFGGGASGKLYKDLKSGVFKSENDLMGKLFLIHDSLAKWNWELGAETKKIGEYTCYKATATRILSDSELEMQDTMRERVNNNEESQDNSDDEESAPEVVIAWYTLDIPVSHGPEDYHGLPGLILEVNDGRTTILCSKIVLNPEKNIDIKAPEKGKVVTQSEFEEIRLEKAKEMETRMGGQGRRGDGHRMIIRGN